MTEQTDSNSHAHAKGARGARGTELRVVQFHGDEIVTFEHDGAPYVAMRRIVDNMGMAWASQHPKLMAQKSKFNCHDIVTVGEDGKQRDMLCMPVDKLQLWLASINPNKVRDAVIRAKVERYQAESAIALHDYWTKGSALRGDTDGIITGIAPKVMDALGGMVKGILHKQLSAVVPGMVERSLLESGHVVSTDFKPALAVLVDRKVPKRKRRAFSQKVSSRLRRFSTQHGHPQRLSRETGRYLFHVEGIKAWLKDEGERLIAEHIAALAGQGVLAFVKPVKGE